MKQFKCINLQSFYRQKMFRSKGLLAKKTSVIFIVNEANRFTESLSSEAPFLYSCGVFPYVRLLHWPAFLNLVPEIFSFNIINLPLLSVALKNIALVQ